MSYLIGSSTSLWSGLSVCRSVIISWQGGRGLVYSHCLLIFSVSPLNKILCWALIPCETLIIRTSYRSLEPGKNALVMTYRVIASCASLRNFLGYSMKCFRPSCCVHLVCDALPPPQTDGRAQRRWSRLSGWLFVFFLGAQPPLDITLSFLVRPIWSHWAPILLRTLLMIKREANLSISTFACM